MFSPKIGEMIPFDENIFQMGWFNHQLALFSWYVTFTVSEAILKASIFRGICLFVVLFSWFCFDGVYISVVSRDPYKSTN